MRKKTISKPEAVANTAAVLNLAPKNITESPSIKTPFEEKLERERKEDARMVKGVFQDNEVRNGNVHFFFKKYKGDPIAEYKLFDGMEYELPLGVVKHLNSGCAYMTHSNLLDKDGMPMKNTKKTHRFSFKVAEYN